MPLQHTLTTRVDVGERVEQGGAIEIQHSLRSRLTAFHSTISINFADSSRARELCAEALKSTVTEVALSILIAISFILVIVEADHTKNPPAWIAVANHILLVIYMMEAAVRIFVLRSRYFCSAMNLMDLTIVVSDVIAELIDLLDFGEMPSLVALRVFRLLRLTRSVKVMVKFPQLALLVKGLANALSAVVYGVILVVVMVLFWAVCAVHFIHPINQRVSDQGLHGDCSRCVRAFETVFQSSLTFVQQVIAGDSWGQVTIPIIEESPLTAVFFAGVFLSISLTLLNVILAVIVDTALKTSQEDVTEVVKQKHEQYKKAEQTLTRLCAEIDVDGSGDLSKKELVNSFENNKEFRHLLESMDISKRDLDGVFSMLDRDHLGAVKYSDFVSELFKMKSHDSHTLLIFINHHVNMLMRSMHKRDLAAKETKLDDFSVPMSKDDAAGVPGVGRREEKQTEERKAFDAEAVVPGSYPDLGEELRKLREVINQELVHSMREINSMSERQAVLLASIAGSASGLPANRTAASSHSERGSSDQRLPPPVRAEQYGSSNAGTIESESLGGLLSPSKWGVRKNLRRPTPVIVERAMDGFTPKPEDVRDRRERRDSL